MQSVEDKLALAGVQAVGRLRQDKRLGLPRRNAGSLPELDTFTPLVSAIAWIRRSYSCPLFESLSTKYDKKGNYVGTKKTSGAFKSIVRLAGRSPKRIE